MPGACRGQHGFESVASAATCPTPAAKTWNHLVFEFQRQTGGNLMFTAITFNGQRSVVNLSMQHTADSASGLDVAYQSDANGSGHAVGLAGQGERDVLVEQEIAGTAVIAARSP